MTTHDEVGLDIEPILNVFGGADGGVAFARLRHTFLPEMYANESLEAERLVVMVKQFSRLCELMLKK